MASFAQMTAGAPAGLNDRQKYNWYRQNKPSRPMAGGAGGPNTPTPSPPMGYSPPPAQAAPPSAPMAGSGGIPQMHKNATLISGYAPPPRMGMPAGRTFARFGTR